MGDSEHKLVLIDGMALAYRGHFALLRNPRVTSGGLNTSAIFVFATVLAKLVEDPELTHLAVAFDTAEPTERHRVFPEYKATRDAMPEELATQMPYLDRLCEALHVPVLRYPGYEADDVIGTLAHRAADEGWEVTMVTPDKDFGQLVRSGVRILKPGRRGDDDELLDEAAVCAQWGVERIDQVVDVLGLMGDTSDNVPGVPGIGPKTAQQLVATYGSVEDIYRNLAELKGKRRENLETYREQALLSKRLVTIDTAVPVDHAPVDLVRGAIDRERLAALFDELEFKSLGQRLLGEDYEPSLGDHAGEPATLADVFHDYRIADDDAAIEELLGELRSRSSFCFDVETTGRDPRHDELVGIAFSWQEHTGWYLPVPADGAAARALVARFAGPLADPAIEKIGHNLKFDIASLACYGVEVGGPLFDTMIAAWLCLPDSRRSMDALAEQLLHYRPVPITQLIGDGKAEPQTSMREIALAQIAEYATEDADVTWQLAAELRPMLAEHGAERVFHEVECPLVPVLVAMEAAGIRVDIGELSALSQDMAATIDELTLRITELAGEEFNLNSPKQLGEILFDKLQLDPNAKKTAKSGQYKTNEQVLLRLAERHELPQAVLDYRMLTKLRGTYLDSLPAHVEADGRIHSHFEQAVTSTGRMASHDPNLQNIPIRSERGREIRRAFRPTDADHRLLSADYAQVELRIAAELSGDEGLRAAFASDTDIHTATAMTVFGVSADEVDGELRRRAKMVNFGILYGLSPFGLAERLGIPRYEAKDIIEAYFAGFPKLRAWLDATIDFAREHGYVETVIGRRRYLRDIDSKNRAVRQAAERNAINAPVQGTNADMIKLAMIRIHRELAERALGARLLLQVHDELVLDVPVAEVEAVRELVIRNMRDAVPMTTPIEVEVGIGGNWLEAH